MIACGSKTTPTEPPAPPPAPPPTPSPTPSRIIITPSSVELSGFGETAQLSATVYNTDNSVASGGIVFWSSSNTDVATVNSEGLVTAHRSGTVHITARLGELTGTMVISVMLLPNFISLAPTSIGPGESGKLFKNRFVATVVDSLGAPVIGATWGLNTDERSGWVYPDQGMTTADGQFEFSWVAGAPGLGVLTLTFEDDALTTTQTAFETRSIASQQPPHSSVTIYMDHNGVANGYSIDLTPLSEPDKTFYAALAWDGGYAGLQRGGTRYDRQLQFSIWDVPGGGNAQVIEASEGLFCENLGNEGTGQACELNYPWRIGDTYRFEMTEMELNGGSAITLHVTDLSSESRQYIGTLRYADRARLEHFVAFVEDFRREAPTCLDQNVRSAAIRRAMVRIEDSWQPIDEGYMTIYEEDTGNPGTPSCANRTVLNHAAGLEMVIGGRTTRDPDSSRWFKIPQ